MSTPTPDVPRESENRLGKVFLNRLVYGRVR